MKQFKVYEIPGVKIGATDRWPTRVREQVYNEADCKVLFETDVLKLASSMEMVLQKKHGYAVDQHRYEDTYNWHHGKVVSEETRAKLSKIATQREAEIAADPVRNASRSENMLKARAEIAADPVRNASRSENMLKARAEIANDSSRNAARSVNISKANAEIAADPVRAASKRANKSKAARENQAHISYQIDPETGITVGVFQSTAAVAWMMGYKSSGSITKAKRSHKTARGFLWK